MSEQIISSRPPQKRQQSTITGSGGEVGTIPTDGDIGLVTVTPGHIDTGNSTSTPLDADAVFTGTSGDTINHGVIVVSVFSNVASATDGLCIEFSIDNTNWDHSDTFTIPANTGKTFTFQTVARYFRVVYTNGGTDQTTFRLQTIMKPYYVKPSSHRIQDAIIGEDDAELVKSVLTGQDPDGIFQNVSTTVDGDLTVSDNSDGLAIAKGDVTGHTFIHKFGHADDFDTADGEVAVWDGADDALFSGSPPMIYTYSATADIGLISSSSGSDTGDIEIQGLDGSGNLVTQTITLNGQTDVDISGVGGTDLKRVFRMKNVSSSDFVGVVYLRTNGSTQTSGVPDTANTVRAIVNNGNNQTEMALYTIPTGKTGYMRDWYASTAGASRSSNYIIKLRARPSGGVFQLKHRTAISDTGTSSYQHKYEEPEVFAAGTDLEMTAEMTAGGGTQASVSAGFDIVLVDN